jgi:hypothetical protein
MTTEKVSIEQAVQRLSDASINQTTHMTNLAKKIADIETVTEQQNQTITEKLTTNLSTLESNMVERIQTIQLQTQDWQTNTMTKLEEGQQQWNSLTDAVRDMKNEIQKVMATIIGNPSTNNTNHATEEYGSIPYAYRNTSTPNGTSDLPIPIDSTISNEHRQNHHTAGHTNSTISNSPVVHTVVVPPTSAIPIFYGKISENPRQFLIRIKEYTKTVNQWDDTVVLNGISQFLRDTALDWYCQLCMNHRRPQLWTEFVDLFLIQFNSPIRRARQEQEWRECKQNENETINQFVVRLRTLWCEQKPKETETDLIRHLLCKMRQDLLSMIGVSKCESIDEIVIEAQKIEEILYRRSKHQRQNNNFQQGSTYTDTFATAGYYDKDYYTRQTKPSYRTNQPYYSYDTTRYKPQYRTETGNQTRYNDYPSNNRRQTSILSEMKCYTCGMKGHLARDCTSQYNYDQHQQADYYTKNDNGAQGERDYGAPQ